MKAAARGVFSTSRKQARAINRIEAEGAVIHVLNGQGGANTKAVNIASNLSRKGFDAQVPPIADGKADSDDYKATLITVYNGAGDVMPETVTKLKRTFKDKNARVIEADDADQDADIVIIVGGKTAALKP